MALDRTAILAHTGVMDRREVHVPEWADAKGDDVVLVRGMTSKEWDTHQARVLRNREKGKDQSNVTAELVIKCVINADGTPLFEAADASYVGELSVASLDKLGRAILELSGIVEPDEDADDDAESSSRLSLVKNSAAGQTGSSSSSSPAS